MTPSNLPRERPVGQDLERAVEHFRPTRADLQARVDALRAELKAAEAELLGPGVPALAAFLLGAFDNSKLRRLVRYCWPSLEAELPPGLSPKDLAERVATLIATAGTMRTRLRKVLGEERPRRQQDIDAALASWGEL